MTLPRRRVTGGGRAGAAWPPRPRRVAPGRESRPRVPHTSRGRPRQAVAPGLRRQAAQR